MKRTAIKGTIRMNNLEMSLSGFESIYSSIKNVLMGKYTFREHTEIMHPNQTGNLYPELTEIHESQHLHICSSTPFGLFQKFISSLLDDNIPKILKRGYQSTMIKTIKHSWYAHEGVATAVQMVSAWGLGGPELYHNTYRRLPKNYKKAYELFKIIIEETRLPVFASFPLAEAVGHIVFSTTILDDMRDHENVLTTNWEDYFADENNSPNARLSNLSPVLSKNKLKELSNVLLTLLKNEFNGVKLTPEELVKRYNTLLYAQRIRINDIILDTTISTLKSEIPFSLEGIGIEKINQKLQDFVGDTTKYLNENKIPIRNYQIIDLSKDTNDRLEHSLSISYIHPDKDTFCINIKNSPNLWKFIQDTNQLLYIYFLANITNEDVIIDDAKVMIVKPNGGYLRMHSVISYGKQVEFRLPFNNEYENPCTFTVTQDEIDILQQLKYTGHMLTMNLSSWRFISQKYRKEIPSLFDYPLYIQMEDTTFKKWEQIIKLELDNGGIRLLQQHVNSIKIKYCILIAKNQHHIYIGPTSQHVIDRILLKYKKIKKFKITEKLKEQLLIYIHHHSEHRF